MGRCQAGMGSAIVVRLLPKASVWSEMLLLEHISTLALTHPAAIIAATHLYRGRRDPALA